MTTTEEVTTTTVTGLVDIASLKAAIACASTDRSRAPALNCVAFVLNGDRFDVQSTDSHVMFWTGDKPADAGHLLVDAKEVTAALKALTVKPGHIVAVTFTETDATFKSGSSLNVYTTQLMQACYPNLSRIGPTGSLEVESIGLGLATTTKLLNVCKALDTDFYRLTFSGALKPVVVSFTHAADSHMLVMPWRA